MGQVDFRGIYEDALTRRVKIREYSGGVPHETVQEIWYKLNIEEARRFIDKKDWIERKIEQGKTLDAPWIKLITYEYTHTLTGVIRRDWATSLRPYKQGYGCDGTTDLNIHALANRLAMQQGLDYPSLMRRAYPDDFSLTDKFQWLEDDDVLAETLMPKVVDPELALQDLEAINNYTLAIEFGIELFKLGVITTDWAEIRNFQNTMAQRISKMFMND